MKNINRTFDILPYVLENYPQKIAIAGKINNKWENYSSAEFYENTQYVSSGLLELGYASGDVIASITTNIPEWNFIDMGMSQLGIIHVPIYPNISQDEYDFILNHCESKMVFISDEVHYKKIIQIVDKSDKIKSIYEFGIKTPFFKLVQIQNLKNNSTFYFYEQVIELNL